MIWITGDMHGDFSRFKKAPLKNLKAGDTLLVCGDFGFLWEGTRQEEHILQKISSLKYTVAFVDGCHENFELLERFPVTTWNGGKVRKLSENLIHLMRGQVFTIEGKKIFTFGGGHSQDFDFRRESHFWWPQEQPSVQEIMEAIENLEANDTAVDLILTHEPPASLKDCLGVDTQQRLEMHTFFEDIMQNCSFTAWYFGKCHINKHIPTKFYAIFDQAVQFPPKK